MLLFPLLLAFKELLNLWSECLSFWPSLGAWELFVSGDVLRAL